MLQFLYSIKVFKDKEYGLCGGGIGYFHYLYASKLIRYEKDKPHTHFFVSDYSGVCTVNIQRYDR